MTKSLVKSLFLAGLLVLWAAGCDDNGNGEQDADADVTPDPTPDPTQEDVTPDPTQEDVTPDPTDEDVPADTPEEEAVACPEDNPPADIYIDIGGTVRSLDGTALENSWAAAISPTDALTEPVPTPLGTATVDSDGAFAMTCVDVGQVAFGLVILHDDDPAGTDNFYPTGTGVKAWATDTERAEDITGAAVFGISQTLAAGIEIMASVDIDADGLAMGMIVDGSTGTPIEGATISRSGGDAINVIYPNATFDGVGASTSSTGIFIITDALPMMIMDLTAEATGFTFEDHQAATKAGFIYFLMIAGTP